MLTVGFSEFGPLAEAELERRQIGSINKQGDRYLRSFFTPQAHGHGSQLCRSH
jgi:hypothetical protein